MKTIGEQAKEFRESREWSTKEMAAACHTSRQNIETLEAKGSRTPRYIKELARVMGTTVDVLMEGRYVAGKPALPAAAKQEATADMQLPFALNVVAEALAKSDRFARVWPKVSRLLSEVAEEPEQYGTFAQRVQPLVRIEVSAESATDNESKPTQFGGLLSAKSRFPNKDNNERLPIKNKGHKANG